MLDRRQLITSLAAVAGAGLGPTLPACGAAWDFPTIFYTSRTVILSSPWHYDQDPIGRIAVQHCNTGVTLLNEPTPEGWPSFHFAACDSDSLRWATFGHAAGHVACLAYLFRSMREHRGAIYLRYPRSASDDIATADAPPLLPPIGIA